MGSAGIHNELCAALLLGLSKAVPHARRKGQRSVETVVINLGAIAETVGGSTETLRQVASNRHLP